MKFVSNIDTICILVDIENYEIGAKEIIKYLEKEKYIVKSAIVKDANYKHLVKIGDMSFYLSNCGTKGYAYILNNNGFQINIAQFRSKLDNFLPIQVRISSEYLWAYGLSTSWSIIYNWLVENFGNIINEKVFRLDLCSHVSNVDFISNYENIYKGNFKKKEVFYTGNIINSITFGSRKNKNIYCRIYNKSLEIQEKRHKLWFKEIWQNNGIDINNVWNIEFEIKSDFLRQIGINNVDDVLKHLQSIWKYCTCNWLIKVDRINTRIERCPINNDWLNIQNNYNDFVSLGIIKLDIQSDYDANSLIPNIVGNIISYSARKNKNNIDEVFENLIFQTKKYLKNKDTCFENEVNKKMELLSKK